MKVINIVRQYENQELCQKWNNNIPLSELEGDKYILLTDSQELQALCDNFACIPPADITGAIVTVLDGDYGEVYVTESSHPYSLQSIYYPLSYYCEE